MKACLKLDHMTQLGYHGNHSNVLKWLKGIFLLKPKTKNTAQMAIVLVFNESAYTKIALYAT